MRLLIVEDDQPVALYLQRSFEAEQYAVDWARDGNTAISMFQAQPYDLMILDLNLPGVDGLDVLRLFRANNTRTPVLALTSRRQVEDKVKTLDSGADDYLPKPFAFSELAARARALLRRKSSATETILRVEDLELNRVDRIVKRAGRQIELTPKELALLEFLMQHAGECVTRGMILEQVWKLSLETMTNVVDVYINYLRKKIDEGAAMPLIHTIRGSGYQLGAIPAANRKEVVAEEADAVRAGQGGASRSGS